MPRPCPQDSDLLALAWAWPWYLVKCSSGDPAVRPLPSLMDHASYPGGSSFKSIQHSRSPVAEICFPRDICKSLEVCLIGHLVVREELLWTSGGWRPGTLLNMLECTGHPLPRRMVSLKGTQCLGREALSLRKWRQRHTFCIQMSPSLEGSSGPGEALLGGPHLREAPSCLDRLGCGGEGHSATPLWTLCLERWGKPLSDLREGS